MMNSNNGLKRSMGRLMFFIWFLPLLCMAAIITFFLYSQNMKLIDDNIEASLKKGVELFEIQLEYLESASKSASYYSDIRSSYYQYSRDGYYSSFSNVINNFLNKEYKYNSNCKAAYLSFHENPENVFYTCNYSAGGKYKDVDYYKRYINKNLLDVVSSGIDTSIVFYKSGPHIYLVRNLMSGSFKPLAVLALEINTESLIKSIKGVYGCDSIVVYYDGDILYADDLLLFEGCNILNPSNNKVLVERADGHYVSMGLVHEDHEFSFVIKVKDNIASESMQLLKIVFVVIILLMIPFFVVASLYFRKRINDPIIHMVDAYDRIRNRDYGYIISRNEKSSEFRYMQESFNHMSVTLKEQFDKIYSEEIALRDARIMALQSQINPHFLNNTLEIINWEARLNENYKVSSMIEALSTMLEATMNRKGEQMISIREEMAYVDAYLYIISQRLGDSFVCTKEIDELLMDEKIPRLIIQPIVENAVDHGIATVRNSRIKIRLYSEGELIHIEIINSGKLKDEDRERINHLLYDEIDEKSEKRVSLGIRNVDKRIRLTYDNDCGLFIYNNDEDETVSTILLKKYKGA